MILALKILIWVVFNAIFIFLIFYYWNLRIQVKEHPVPQPGCSCVMLSTDRSLSFISTVPHKSEISLSKLSSRHDKYIHVLQLDLIVSAEEAQCLMNNMDYWW